MRLHVPDTVKIVQYADDTQVMISGRKSELPALIDSLETVLKSVSNWFSSRKMKVNAKMTQLIVTGTPQMLRGVPTVRIRFGGETITETQKVRNLGLEMDRHMTCAAAKNQGIRSAGSDDKIKCQAPRSTGTHG